MEDYREIEMDEDQEDDADYMDEEAEQVEELIPVTLPTVSNSITDVETLLAAVVINYIEPCQGKPENQDNGGSDGGKEELNRGEIDGLFCPICFEAWTNTGDHRICCLPCGHIYGSSCIKKWLQRTSNSGKCPHCKSLCTLYDVRVLYGARLCVADEMLHNKVKSLEAKCTTLEQKAEIPLEAMRQKLSHFVDLVSTTLQDARESGNRPTWVDEIS